ncbi:unnamed protein product, partial [Musa acuminata subsp. burmannicoides]
VEWVPSELQDEHTRLFYQGQKERHLTGFLERGNGDKGGKGFLKLECTISRQRVVQE